MLRFNDVKQVLLESPEAIRQWCQKVHQAGPAKAPYMLAPLTELSYNRLDPELVQTVEDTLYFGVFGVERPHHRGASPKTGPTPRFSASRMSPSRRSSLNFSSGRPKPPKAV